MKKIEIYSIDSISESLGFYPEPAKKHIPEWYKKLSNHISDEKTFLDKLGNFNYTAKMCVPVLDSLTSGYLFFSSSDVTVGSDDYTKKFFWSDPDMSVVGTHSQSQVSGLTIPDGFSKDPYKWQNYWVFKTPPGYSTLFFHPFYRFDLPFVSLPAIVDTDKYNLPINFPFLIKKDFIGTINRGTPIIQAVPIKRDSWKSKIIDVKEDFSKKQHHLLKSFSERGYKKIFWNRKEYG